MSDFQPSTNPAIGWTDEHGEHHHAPGFAATVEAYLYDAGITPEVLRYAATHESLCRSWIFDLLMGLADVVSTATTEGNHRD